MTAPERFADSQIPLAPRAPSIHDPQRKSAYSPTDWASASAWHGPRDGVGAGYPKCVPNSFAYCDSHAHETRRLRPSLQLEPHEINSTCTRVSDGTSHPRFLPKKLAEPRRHGAFRLAGHDFNKLTPIHDH